MITIIKAELKPADPRYPIVIDGPEWQEKLDRDEAVQLVGELLDAINKLDASRVDTEIKLAA